MGATSIDIAQLLSDGPRNTEKRAIAACLPADGLAHCALTPVTGRELRSVLTTGPPATAGGYSPLLITLTNNPPLVNEAVDNGRTGRLALGTIPLILAGGLTLNDASPRLSKLVLACAALGAGLNLASSVRTRGVRRTTFLFVLGTGLPATGELLATGPLKLLRHRLRYRISGVPLAILLGWYCVIHGSSVVARRISERLRPGKGANARTLAVVAALVGTSLDLILDPAGLDAGLWEWNADGAYAAEIQGANRHNGVPFVNYLGWIALVGGVVYFCALSSERGNEADTRELLPALLLVPLYLATTWWAIRRRRFRYLLYSAPFPVAIYTGLEKK